MIIGITGTDGAGKGTVVDYLVKEKSFVHYSARAIFEEEIKNQGLESNRTNMRLVANELRGKYGNDYLVTYYFEKIKTEGVENVVIESIRAEAEAKTLQEDGGVLLAVDANQKVRYERIAARGSSSDDVSFEEFAAHEAIEMNDPDPNGMQKAKVMEMADYTINNDTDIESFNKEIEKFLTKYTA